MEILIRNSQKKIPIPQLRIIKTAKTASRKLNFDAWTISVFFVGPQRMRVLNNKYLSHDFVTDVLTFNLGDKQGEIIICPYVASKNAKKYNNSVSEEILLYFIHGLLHLAGFDDHTDADIVHMRRMEKKLLYG